MRRNKTNIALNPLAKTKRAEEKLEKKRNRRRALTVSNANKNNAIDFFHMVNGGVHLAGVSSVAATMENWNDDKSNFI